MLGLRRPLQLVALLTATLASAAAASAADPRLSNLEPQGGQRGTEMEVRIVGQRLGDVEALMFDESGIEVLELKPEKDNVFTARLKLAADCRLGGHSLWVRTKTGVSNVQTLFVGALPIVNEVEPNNEFETPQKFELNSTLAGVANSEDVDYYALTAKKGQRISCEIVGLRMGRTFFDPFVAILDTRRFELARSDDSALLRQDGVCSIVAPADGEYIIEVRESAYQGNGASTYLVHVGTFPRPTAVYPAGGRPGETVEVRWLGDALGARTEKVTLPTDPNAGGLLAQDEHGVAPSANPFRLNDLQNTLEVEPNDERKQPTEFVAPGAVNGVIQTPGDVDWFKFSAKKDQQYDIQVYARDLRTPLDPVIEIYKTKGGRLANNDDNAGSPDSYLRFKADADDDYLLQIKDHLDAGGEDYVYRIEITPVVPKLPLTASEFERYISPVLAVPRGNRATLLINAPRANFGGELQIEFPELPPGVTLHRVPMPADKSTIAVVLSAAADAPLGGIMAPLTAKPTDANIAVEGRFERKHSLVRGQNNVDVWTVSSDRIPLVVTEEAPFKIDVIAPKVPLVQGGSMNLKVVAQRKEGFTAPIAIRLLENPPGVSSNASIKIEEGKTEAEIPLTANGGAAAAISQIVVIGQADVGGNLMVASELTPLEVATPFFALTMQKTAVEQGQEVTLLVNVEQKKEFAGAAKVELLGIPAGTTTEPLELTKDMEQLQFKIKTAADAREGKHTSLVCNVVFTQHDEPITHTFGGGELQIDKPLPPKTEPPKTDKPAEPAPVVAKTDAPKPLSRLEKLRQQAAGK